MYSFTLRTNQHEMMINITKQIESILHKSGVRDGILIVSSTHTTAGIVVNENADPDVKLDLMMRLNELAPWKHPDDRHAEGNTAAHLKAILTGNSQMIGIQDGRLVLGQWQGIYFCEFDGPRERTVMIKIIAG